MFRKTLTLVVYECVKFSTLRSECLLPDPIFLQVFTVFELTTQAISFHQSTRLPHSYEVESRHISKGIKLETASLLDQRIDL